MAGSMASGEVTCEGWMGGRERGGGRSIGW